jgi:hypothetical protein
MLSPVAMQTLQIRSTDEGILRINIQEVTNLNQQNPTHLPNNIEQQSMFFGQRILLLSTINKDSSYKVSLAFRLSGL